MNHGSLFSGIGGFDLASEWMGWENIFNCEIEEFPRKVLNYYWPNAKSYEDIKTTDFSIWRGKIDILTGGFPCQPFSTAGKRRGTEDNRYLWPEMHRAVREIKPPYIVAENVYGLVNLDGGLVFKQVQSDLEAEGYEVLPIVLPASSIGAPHQRKRIWFVCGLISNTSSNGQPRNKEFKEGFDHIQERISCNESDPLPNDRNATNTERKRQQEQGQPKRPLYKKENREWKASWAYDDGRWPTQPPVCSRNDGLSSKLVGITFSKWRQESIKAYGNAIVPQVAYEIFKVIQQIESEHNFSL